MMKKIASILFAAVLSTASVSYNTDPSTTNEANNLDNTIVYEASSDDHPGYIVSVEAVDADEPKTVFAQPARQLSASADISEIEDDETETVDTVDTPNEAVNTVDTPNEAAADDNQDNIIASYGTSNTATQPEATQATTESTTAATTSTSTDDREGPTDEAEIDTAIFFAYPGMAMTFSNVNFWFTDFVEVTQVTDGTHICLSGQLPGQESWWYTIDNGTPNTSYGELPFTVNDGYVLAPALAAVRGEEFVARGFTFVPKDEEEVISYSQVDDNFFIQGDGWTALALDYRRYSEWKYARMNGELPELFDGNLITWSQDTWIIANGEIPEILNDQEKYDRDFDKICEKVANSHQITGFTDPTWGAISWEETCYESWLDDGSAIYTFTGNIQGKHFVLNIEDDAPIGFCHDYTWSAAIIDKSVVNINNDASLGYGAYDIKVGDGIATVSADGKEAVEIELTQPQDQYVLFTVSDGKHAKVITADAALLAIAYAIVR